MTLRTGMLDQEISKAMRQGWRVVSVDKDAGYAQFEKRASGVKFLVALILLCCILVPGILYILLCPKRIVTLIIEVAPDGRVRRTEK
jgi:hypothetical protein